MITFCLMTCGEETEQLCLRAIAPYKDKIVLQEVRNVFPQVVALNQMLSQCKTEYLVPLDADMILNSDSLTRIEQAINQIGAEHHSILFSLFDTLTQKKIMALKVLRMSIMKNFPFNEVSTPDVEHFSRLKEAGYCALDLTSEEPIGTHNVQGFKFCYSKYKDVYQTLRTYGKSWDSAVFMGGETIMEKSKKHFEFFEFNWIMTGNEDYLYCIAGMLDGLTCPLENKSKTLEEIPEINPHLVLDQYISWYLNEQKLILEIVM